MNISFQINYFQNSSIDTIDIASTDPEAKIS